MALGLKMVEVAKRFNKKKKQPKMDKRAWAVLTEITQDKISPLQQMQEETATTCVQSIQTPQAHHVAFFPCFHIIVSEHNESWQKIIILGLLAETFTSQQRSNGQR